MQMRHRTWPHLNVSNWLIVLFWPKKNVFLAPIDMQLNPTTSSSITVTFVPNPLSNGTVFYHASVLNTSVEQSCTVQATASPLQCFIYILNENTTYMVSGVACFENGTDCSQAIVKNATTWPDRKQIKVFPMPCPLKPTHQTNNPL